MNIFVEFYDYIIRPFINEDLVSCLFFGFLDDKLIYKKYEE